MMRKQIVSINLYRSRKNINIAYIYICIYDIPKISQDAATPLVSRFQKKAFGLFTSSPILRSISCSWPRVFWGGQISSQNGSSKSTGFSGRKCRWSPRPCQTALLQVHSAEWDDYGIVPRRKTRCLVVSYGCFLKWWYPKTNPKWSFLVGKPMVVGYQHFRKTPYIYFQKGSKEIYQPTCLQNFSHRKTPKSGLDLLLSSVSSHWDWIKATLRVFQCHMVTL